MKRLDEIEERWRRGDGKPHSMEVPWLCGKIREAVALLRDAECGHMVRDPQHDEWLARRAALLAELEGTR